MAEVEILDPQKTRVQDERRKFIESPEKLRFAERSHRDKEDECRLLMQL
jgi:hypothetical protein